MDSLIGSLKQQELVDKYAEFVSLPKAKFFEQLGLSVIQGKREGIYIEMLEGLMEGDPAMKLIDCRTSGGVFNLGHQHPEIIKAAQYT